MGQKYLYGARAEDSRYLQTFHETYSSIGDNVIDDLKAKFTDTTLKNNLNKIMDKGIENAERLAKEQAKVYGYESNIDKFCQDFNILLDQFEILSYRLLEYTSTDQAYRLVEKMLEPKTIVENSEKVSKEKKVLAKIEKDVDGATADFWNILSGMVKSSDSSLTKLLPQLIADRQKDIVERGFKYGPGYAGHLGEGAEYLLAKAMVVGKGAIINALQNQFRNSNVKVEIVGSEGKKADLLLGSLSFSIKNYTVIRDRFMKYTEMTDKQKALKKSSVDISIQKTGLLETVIKNFESDLGTSIFINNSDDIFSYIMNALYYNEFNLDEYYEKAMQALDILVNVYAYVFLVQGTAKKGGYIIEDLKNNNTLMPGFMWFTGKGIVPVYKILEEIKDNFEIILNKTRAQSRSGTYAFVKIRGVKQGVKAVDILKPRPIYSEEEMTTDGLFYRKSFNSTTSKYQNIPNILSGRYDVFSKNITSSIKLHLQIAALNRLISNANI